MRYSLLFHPLYSEEGPLSTNHLANLKLGLSITKTGFVASQLEGCAVVRVLMCLHVNLHKTNTSIVSFLLPHETDEVMQISNVKRAFFTTCKVNMRLFCV